MAERRAVCRLSARWNPPEARPRRYDRGVSDPSTPDETTPTDTDADTDSDTANGVAAETPGPTLEPRWHPRTTGDGSATLHHPRYDETYHSHHGAVSEARHVFVGLSGVAARLAAGRPTRILEIGFGTGLNFLATVDAAQASDAAGASGTAVHYTAYETDPPPVAALRGFGYEARLADPAPAEALWRALEAWADAPASGGRADATLRVRVGGVALELRRADATRAPLGAAPEARRYHAIYLDAFSAEVQPELWSEPFLARLAAALAPGGCLSTYSVKGVVRRRLAGCGLEVAKRPGPPGGKREALVARRPYTNESDDDGDGGVPSGGRG